MDERLERVYARWCARSVLHLWGVPEVVRRWIDTGEEALREEAAWAAEEEHGARTEEAWGMDEASESMAALEVAWSSVWAWSVAAGTAGRAAGEEIDVAEVQRWAADAAGWASPWADAVAAHVALVGTRLRALEQTARQRSPAWKKAAALEAARRAEEDAFRAARDERAAWEERPKAKQAEVRALLEALPDLLRTHGLAARLLDDARAEPWLTREVVRALSLPDFDAWCDWCAQMMEVE